MEAITTKIKERIKQKTKVSLFADDIGIRQATLYDFLNQKIDIKLPTLMRIIEPLNMNILENMPDTFIEVDAVYLGNKTIKKGQTYKKKEVVVCFGNTDTTYQGILLKGKDDLFTLKVF
jgi:hypothetical protein